jgi:lipopolysaccharide transport system permease protein
MLPWQMFSNAVTESSNSLVANASMLSKVYFPRLIVPTSAVIVSLIDFVISLGILGALMVWYGFVPEFRIIAFPLFLLLVIVAALGLGIWTAALNVKYRDFRYIVPFLVQFGMYISPVGFSSSVIPDNWRLIYSINPMVGAIDGFRWAILGGHTPLYLPGLGLSVVLAIILFWLGLRYFRKTERIFADVI